MRTIGNWERGETVPMNRLTALEDALGVTLTGPVHVTAIPGEVDLLIAHYGKLSPGDRLRLSRLVQDQALRDLGVAGAALDGDTLAL